MGFGMLRTWHGAYAGAWYFSSFGDVAAIVLFMVHVVHLAIQALLVGALTGTSSSVRRLAEATGDSACAGGARWGHTI